MPTKNFDTENQTSDQITFYQKSHLENLDTSNDLPESLLPKVSPLDSHDKLTSCADEDNDIPPLSMHSPSLKIAPLHRLTGGSEDTYRHFEVLKQWICEIVKVQNDSVWALLSEDAIPNRAVEVVELPLVEIPKADHDLLVPGNVFYWTIGYEKSRGGTERRVSEIRMRRTPRWASHHIESVKKRAHMLLSLLEDGSDSATATS